MATGTSKRSSTPRTFKVRFLSSVKMGGRWYNPGEEIVLSAKIAREFLRRGLVEKLKDSRGG